MIWDFTDIISWYGIIVEYPIIPMADKISMEHGARRMEHGKHGAWQAWSTASMEHRSTASMKHRAWEHGKHGAWEHDKHGAWQAWSTVSMEYRSTASIEHGSTASMEHRA